MKTTKIGRLALRVEGDYWNAYYAIPDTMEDAVFFASIRMGEVEGRPKITQAFMDLMRQVVTEIIKEKTGVEVEWDEVFFTPAPEHERAGRA